MNDPFSYLGVSRDSDRAKIKEAFVRKLEKCCEEKSSLDSKEYERRIREARIAYEAASKIAWARCERDLDDMDGDGGMPLSASERLARRLIATNEWKPKSAADDERQSAGGSQDSNAAKADELGKTRYLPKFTIPFFIFVVLLLSLAMAYLLFFCFS